MKRNVSLLLALLMLMLPLCANADAARNPTEEALMAYTDVMELDALEELWAASDSGDHAAAWILENFKIDMRNLEVDLSGKFEDTVRARVAAGDIPGMIMTFNRSLALELAETGEFLDLYPLLREHAPNLMSFIGEEVLDKYADANGALYVLPGDTAPVDDLTPYIYAQDACMINTELLERTGMSAPTNTDELYEYLKAISGMEVNGQKVIPIANNDFLPSSYTNVEYPISSNPGKLMFMLEPGTGYNYLTLDDESRQIDLVYDHPVYKKYLTFFNKLYREKLLDQDIFTMTPDQYQERMKTGAYGFLFADIATTASANTAYSGSIEKPYWPMAFPKDYEGDTNAFTFGVLGGWYFLFNKDIADPARLAKLLDWNYTLEGVRAVNYGAPDPTLTMNCWYYGDNGEVVFDQDLQQQWDAEDYTWNWMRAGGWGFHAAGLQKCIKYTAINEMGLCMADKMYIEVDEKTKNDLTVDSAFEAMTLQPMGEFFLNSGAPLCDLLNKWEVQIVLRAKDEAEVGSMYQQMMEEARAIGYDDMKRELYQMYLVANPE